MTLTLCHCMVLVLLLHQDAPDTDRHGSIELQKARQAFAKVQALCQKDAGKCWGKPLSGPWLFVDPQTRHVVANEPDAQGVLTAKAGLYVGQLPASIPAANTSVNWLGTRWVMVLWPLPSKPMEQGALLMHETWHRLQDALGFPMTNPRNAHLEAQDGRYWLQLEWQALAKAMEATGDVRLRAIKDALLFRSVRRALFPNARVEEQQLEMHEGLAEYTGLHLSGAALEEQRLYLVKELRERPKRLISFTRSFAYLSGPAYGLLLDGTPNSWRDGLKSTDDLGELLRKALHLPEVQPDHKAAQTAALAYDGAVLLAAEKKRDEQQKAQRDKIEALYVQGPVLVLPLRMMQIQLNPNRVIQIDKLGTLYQEARISDQWGVLQTKEGVLISDDFTKAIVPVPRDRQMKPLQGPGWEITLADGWDIAAGPRHGDWHVAQIKK